MHSINIYNDTFQPRRICEMINFNQNSAKIIVIRGLTSQGFKMKIHLTLPDTRPEIYFRFRNRLKIKFYVIIDFQLLKLSL